MTVRLSDYGVTGPWQSATCDRCSNDRSCLVMPVSPDEDLAICVPCLVKDIEVMEREQEQLLTCGGIV